LRVVGFGDIYDFDAVIHTDYNFVLGLGDFDAVGGGSEFDGLAGVAVASGGVPEADGVVVGAAGQFESHGSKSIWCYRA